MRPSTYSAAMWCAPPTALLNMDVRLKNEEAKDIELKAIVHQFGYGNGKPANALLQPITYMDIKEALTGDKKVSAATRNGTRP